MNKEKMKELDKLLEKRRKSIEESGEFVKMEVVVAKDDTMVTPRIEGRGANPIMLAMLVKTIDDVSKKMKEDHPEINYLIKFMSSEEKSFSIDPRELEEDDE